MVLLAGCSPTTTAITTVEMQDSGSWWTRNVVYWFSFMLDKFAEWFGGSYGLSILLLTIIVRTIILPLMIKQYKNTKAMQALQPEMKKVREKYKDDPKKQQEEMMKLYQTNQVNPLAGCLPLIVQMPIFIALYNSIYKNVEIREHTFIGFELGLTPSNSGHWYYYLIPIAAACTTLIQSMMMSKQQTMVGPMKGLMYIFPVMIFVMAINFPVALPLYWIYSNIYTIIQNYFMYRNSPKPAEEATQPKPNLSKGKGKGKGKGANGK
ncbi:YidC/Oxa1 family membrane protein insertase [Cohnella sp. WQ 127256]|uniref:YidC/Oxa1 family membrane protein insertase n=1 Tax=Cohnella sp. WQ 127256 TaxID=2938790 RepID=UPI0035564445